MSVLFGFKKSVCSPRCYEVIQLESEEFEKLKRSGTFEAGFSKTYREGEIKHGNHQSEFITNT